MGYILWTIIFLFGATLGSFIAVIANRYNTGLPFFRGRSFCFSCNTKLQTKDLFPVFSFLFLKGKCRYCGSIIPKDTLVIELIMGVLSVLAALKSGLFDLSLIHNLTFLIEYLLITSIFAVILLISIYDLRHFIIPDSFLIILFVLSLLHNLYLPAQAGLIILGSLSYLIILKNFGFGILLALPFLIMFLVSRGKWLGFGDIKYFFVIGFLLGLKGGVSAVMLAFWVGAAFSLLAISLNKLKINLPIGDRSLTIKSEVPFGPFLSLGIILSFFFNMDLLQIHLIADLL